MAFFEQTRKWDSAVASEQPIALDGHALDIATLVAAARFGQATCIRDDPAIAARMQASVAFLADELAAGHSIYGITTGFGGSADTTTDQHYSLQSALLQMQTSGILPQISGSPAMSYGMGLESMSMPEPWVKAAMIVRINALIRGHSAVRFEVVQTLQKLLDNNIIPLVPLHGSISASGDLSPLSYIAATLEGNPDNYAWVGEPGKRHLVPANVALSSHGITKVRFAAKEGLGILNGTAFSVSVAALATWQANNLLQLSQALTAMSVEALEGSSESFEPFIADIRPHRGQKEMASNILRALDDSKLIQEARTEDTRSLRQDRYATRTASQWLGPLMEDLELANEQIEVELNSTTDNPLFDAGNKQTYHGGNFQATSMTSATEKTRMALQMMGKLIFAQSSELLDCKMNGGLPPNLAFDEPSLSYTLKGVDINMAAYMAELGFLANPVSSHVQSAEMGNQSLNSMALVSARYTHKAVDMVSMMASAHLYSLCQALDLRAMFETFLAEYKPHFYEVTKVFMVSAGCGKELAKWQASMWRTFKEGLAANITKDSSDRFEAAAKAIKSTLVDILTHSDLCPPNGSGSVARVAGLIQVCTLGVAETSLKTFQDVRARYGEKPDASPFLGLAAKRMYNFIRRELDVPLHKGLVDYPQANGGCRSGKLNTGTQISIIYAALKDGRIAKVLQDCF